LGLDADLATKTETLEAGLRHCPYCFGIRVAYLSTIEPRWGGSHRLVEQTAEGWQFTDQNPKLEQLLGLADADRCDLLSDDEPENALPFCDQALAKGRNAGFLSAKATALLRLERYDEAIALFAEALDILPQDVRLLNGRGSALMKAERYDEATRDFVLATRLDPASSQAAKSLHYILAKLVRVAYYQGEAGELDAAIASFDRVLTMHPRYADAFAYRGDAYDKKGNLEQAEKDYREAIRLDPTHLQAYRGLDHVLVQQNRLDEIVKLWNRYLRRKPKDATALFERSGTYHRKGKRELARRDVTAACRFGNKDACDTLQRYYPSP
jgi:tetratricopeptide (TPR) repeat protein